MIATERNIFIVGTKATGESFFGRKEEIRDLSSIFAGVSALHLIAPTKVGKSSLAKTTFDLNADVPKRLCVELCMAAHKDAAAFWKSLYRKLRRAIIDADLLDARLNAYFKEIDEIDQLKSNWFVDFTELIHSILGYLGKKRAIGWFWPSMSSMMLCVSLKRRATTSRRCGRSSTSRDTIPAV